MSAGTLALTNKSDVVKGTGTAFTEMKAGDFIVVSIGGTPYTLTVKSITSDTQLTLISNFTGPTQSGLAWYEVPREAQSLITAALATQTTEALRGQNLDKDNWQQVFSVSNDITVTLKDGSQFTGPSWLKVVDLLKDVDIPALQVIAQQVQDDAESAGLSKDSAAQSAQQASQSASTATTKAQEASASAQSAAESAATAVEKAESASSDAALASGEASRAKSEADRAASLAGSMDFTMTDVKAYADAVMPIGAKIDWPSINLPDNAELGIKFLRLNGSSFSTSQYPKLAALYPSGVLPDMRANVSRGYDDGRGIDQGRNILSEQADGAPNIIGTFQTMNGAASGAFADQSTNSSRLATSTSGAASGVSSFDASRSNAVYGSANEIRMRNLAWNMIVRAA